MPLYELRPLLSSEVPESLQVSIRAEHYGKAPQA